jgi:dephospho-CoA kinase
MKKIYIVNGKPRAGKDTFAELLGKHCRVFKYSSVDKVKQIAAKCGWDGGKTDKDRRFLSQLKKITTEFNDMAYDDVAEKVAYFLKTDFFDVMLIDIREPEEIDRAIEGFGAEAVFIENKNVPAVTTNLSDRNVELFEYDHIVLNNGTLEDFEETVKRFYENNIRG